MRLPKPEDARALHMVLQPLAPLCRLSRWPDTEPWYARDAAYRFDDPAGRAPRAPGATPFGVLYLADSPETAFCESVLHGVNLWVGGHHQVPRSALTSRQLVLFHRPAAPELRLVDLTGDAIKRAGLTNDLVAGDDHRVSQAWAAMLHTAFPDADGLRVPSRQRPGGTCCAVFDRAGVQRLDACALPPNVIEALCRRFNVHPIDPATVPT